MSTPTLDAAPAPASRPAAGRVRTVVDVRADLLPDEVVAARAEVRTRKRVGVALLAVVAVLVAWYGLSWWRTGSAQDDLDAAQQRSVELNQRASAFGELTRVQGELSGVQQQLHQLLANDVQWAKLLGAVRGALPAGVTLTASTATAQDPNTTTGGAGAAAAGGQQVLNTSGKQPVGTLTLSGTAPGKPSVAQFADALGRVKGLAAPLVSDVSAEGSSMTFTITALVTTDALGGRYAAPPAAATVPSTTPSTGGK